MSMAFNLPPGLSEEIIKSEERIREYVLSNEKRIPPARPLLPASFIDGSYAISERRGCLVTLLSAASISAEPRPRLREGLPGSKRPFVAVVFPREYGENRVSYMMKTLEVLAALWEVGRGARLVVLDGSYLTLLLSSYGFPVEAARRGDEPLDEGREAAAAVERTGKLLAGGVGAGVFLEAAGGLLSLYDELFYRAGGSNDLLRVSTYIVLTGLLKATEMLLETVEERGAAVIWVSKDVESRFLSELASAGRWVNDAAALDEAWRGKTGVYLVFEPEKSIGVPSQPVAYPAVLKGLYGRWGGYLVAYVKLAKEGVPLQVTLPARASGLLDAALSTLQALPHVNGYPNPLIYAHHLAVVRREAAERAANSLWLKARGRGVVEKLLAPKGRVMVGLPG